MVAVPQRVEQQRPSGDAFALAAGFAEQLLDHVGQADFLYRRLGRHQRRQLRPTARDPFADRHREAALLRHRLGGAYLSGKPAAEEILAEALAHFELVGQAVDEARDRGIEKWSAAVDAMRHETTVELDQQI